MRIRFRLRSLLVATLVIALVLGWVASRIEDARKERNAVQALSRVHAHVVYTSSQSLPHDSRFDTSAQQSTATQKLDEWLGVRLFGRVIAVHGEYSGLGRGRDQAFADAVAGIADLRHVQLINLDDTAVTDRDLVHFSSLRNLRTLYIRRGGVGDAGVEHIADLKQLRRLGLQRTLVTDAGVEQLRGLENLDTLSLAETQVTDECVPHLVGLKKLRHLDLSFTMVSEQGIARLQSELPQTRIIMLRR